MSDNTLNDIDLKFNAKKKFERARKKAFLNDLMSKLLNKENELLQLDEIKYLVPPKAMVYRGIKSIPIDKIVGSEGRYRDFDRDFLPRQDNTKERWENIEVAKEKNISLPPISVYKIGDHYIVRDGNHRVSVAKELGQEFIDAEVTELFTPVKIEDFSQKGLLIAESYNYFLEKTGFKTVFPDVDIKLSNPWGYYRLIEHINTYRYFLGEKRKREVSLCDALKSWYNELYLPITKLVKKKKILRFFPEREVGDFYIWIMDHWHYLKESGKDIPIEEAVEDYYEKYVKKGFINKIFLLFKKRKK
ncbi:MAG: hypothetical protein N2258_03625 [Brevinematales bacterium]|nr:hypothetical protein [Brevinematales bacterium]